MVAAVPGAGQRGVLVQLTDHRNAATPVEVTDLFDSVAERERLHRPRWLWPSTAELYPRLLLAGVRVERCHDLELAEALLLGAEGHWGEPRSLISAAARADGLPVPPDPLPRQPGTTRPG